jgi:DNA-binding IclR family transcriptional regulator
MNYNELRKALLDYLKKNPHSGLSYNELVNTFQLINTEKSLLSKILSGLQEEGVLNQKP